MSKAALGGIQGGEEIDAKLRRLQEQVEAPPSCAYCDSAPARPDDGDGCCSEACAFALFEVEAAGSDDDGRGDYLRDVAKDGNP